MQRFPITLNFVTIGVAPEVEWRQAGASDGFLFFRSKTERRPLPEELFLRKLLDIDTTDDDSVVGFLDEYGMISRPYFDPGVTPWLAQEALRRPLSDGYRDVANRVEDARWYLNSARALTRHWIAAHEGRDPTTAWTEDGFTVPDRKNAWRTFAGHISEGLTAFAPSVQYSERIGGDDVIFGQPHAGLYSGLCLQLANALAEEAVIRHCAYCGRAFVRQLGSAVMGQYRTEGLKYCTAQHARNQAQREYRRRKKESK